MIPLRGGSKAAPGKNLYPLNGKPLYSYALEQVLLSECFESVYVGTDSGEIARSVCSFYPTVRIDVRSVVSDHQPTDEYLLAFSRRHEFDRLCLVQATSPLVTADDFIRGKQIMESGFDSLLSVSPFRRFLWVDGVPDYDYRNRPRRQDMKSRYVENGAFYMMTRKVLERGSRLGGRIGFHVMRTDLEIDEPEDLRIAEFLTSPGR